MSQKSDNRELGRRVASRKTLRCGDLESSCTAGIERKEYASNSRYGRRTVERQLPLAATAAIIMESVSLLRQTENPLKTIN